MGLATAGSGTPGPFGKAYFFYAWQNYNWDGFFPSSLFSDVSFSENYGSVTFTSLKTLKVVFHVTAKQTPNWYGKVKPNGTGSYTKITEGLAYELTAGTRYLINYDRSTDSDYSAFLIYASDR